VRVLLTGNTGGIGKHIQDKLENSKIEVVVINSKICDLSNIKAIDDFLKNNKIFDGLIHCAAINPVDNMSEVNFNDLVETFNINTFSFIKMCQDIQFTNGSNILAIGSLWATGTKEGRGQYSMTKHALYSAVKTLALEMSNSNIKVNMISPGFVDTEMTRKNNSKEKIKSISDFIPLGLTDPSEIANMCEYFMTNNESITGQNIIIDGGYSVKNI
jgi:NAD(P)-dependent dehydrogenase (short-subunit alcohol dehydrogenase family)